MPFSDNYTVECWETARGRREKLTGSQDRAVGPGRGFRGGMIWRGLGIRSRAVGCVKSKASQRR